MEDSLVLVEQYQDKLIKYLSIEHDYENYNCVTLVCEIHKEFSGCDIKNYIQNTLQISLTSFNSNWYKKFNKDSIDQLPKFKHISLDNIQFLDILCFGKRNIYNHFGLYINNYQFIHIQDKERCKISYIYNFYDKLKDIIRYNDRF